MKGIIFNILEEMVEENFGFTLWNEIIDELELESQGIYTAIGTYDEAELISIVSEISRIKNIPINELIYNFGFFLLKKLKHNYPVFFEKKTLKDFLLSVHDIIHVEVKKLYPQATLPEIKYENPSDDRLVMKYYSERKLCTLAEGLIQGAAEEYGKKISLQHQKCLLKNDDCCQLDIRFL